MFILIIFYSTKLETLRSEHAQEVSALQDQAKRLQVQLNHGYTAFADFKTKKSTEVLDLEAKLTELRAVIEAHDDGVAAQIKV